MKEALSLLAFESMAAHLPALLCDAACPLVQHFLWYSCRENRVEEVLELQILVNAREQLNYKRPSSVSGLQHSSKQNTASDTISGVSQVLQEFTVCKQLGQLFIASSVLIGGMCSPCLAGPEADST